MRRREFLQAGAAVGIGTWAELRLAAQAAQAGFHAQSRVAVLPADLADDTYQAPEWLRYSRSVYFDGYSPPVYPHMRDFDARRLVETVLDVGGNMLRFQPIGYMAYFPSKAFPVHEELGERDLVAEVAKECRRVGVHLYCYVGYGAPIMLTPEYLKQHPKYTEWALQNPEGKPYGSYNHYGWMTPLQRLCKTGDAYREGIRQVVTELCEHDIDGVYFDAPSAFGYTGICFCGSCRENFKKFSGMDLARLNSLAKLNGLPFDWNGNFPADVDMQALTAWYMWADQLAKEDLLDFRRIIHGKGKFMLCHNANTWTGTSLPFQYRVPDGFMVEASREIYDRIMTGMMGAAMARPTKKLAQMYLGGYALSDPGEPPHERAGVAHNSNLEDQDEIRMEGFTNLACGNAPLYATANRLYFGIGGGSLDPVREVFHFMQQVEAVHKDSVPVPYLTIVPTWESQQLWRQGGKSWSWPMMSGAMGLVMLDERISLDVHPSTEMSEEWLSRQKVIALCGASGISDEDARKLTAWVEQGGALLATYDTGLYDAEGRLRQDGGALRTALGVKMKGAPLASQPECYYRILESHPALGAYKPGENVEGDGSIVPVEVVGGAKTIAECWNLGTGEVRGPAVVVNNYGRGRSVYVSGSLEANYLFDRVVSNNRLLRSMVEYLGAGTPQPFKLQAPRGVYGVLRQATNGDRVLWLLANVGFKDAAAGRMRQEFMPVPEVQVSLQIPDGRAVKSLRLLRAGQTIPHTVENGYAAITIPSLHIAEVVQLELG